jgi:hypothetical protein
METLIKKKDGIKLYSVVYKSDGLNIQPYVLKPSGLKCPVVIHIRGGNNHPMHNNKLDIDEDEMLSPRLFNIAKANNVVIATNFRALFYILFSLKRI